MPITDKAIRAKLAAGEIDFTVHALFEAAEDLIFVDEIETALGSGKIIENDDDRRRCLVCASLALGGLVHIVLDYSDWLLDPICNLVVVTVYQPNPDKWIDGRIRRI